MDINVSDPVFLNSLKVKNREAVSYIVKKYSKQLYNAAVGQGLGGDQADEVVQSTWASFFEGVERFEGRSHIRTYVFGILYNKIREVWRYQKKFTDTEDAEGFDDLVDGQMFDNNGLWGKEFSGYAPVDPEAFMTASENMSIINGCLDGLKKKHRMAFYLKEVEGEDSEEICNILGITRTNLGVLLYRAKQLLRKCIEDKYLGKAMV